LADFAAATTFRPYAVTGGPSDVVPFESCTALPVVLQPASGSRSPSDAKWGRPWSATVLDAVSVLWWRN